MSKAIPKTSPSYLLQLARKEGSHIAKVLVTSNQDLIARGERLTPSQLSDLTDITIANLKTKKQLPARLTSERLQAFISPFQGEIIKAGLF